MIYVTGSSGFVGRNLVKRLDNCLCIPHTEIQITDFGDASKVFFLSTYGNMSHHDGLNEVIEANVLDLAHVLSTIDWNKIESFVYFSTSSVKLRVQTSYSRAKRASEEILLAYMEKYEAPITIIRPMSVTGVGEQKRHLIPTLIEATIMGGTVNLVPDPVHDFIDVEDVVNGTLNLSDNKARGIFELGNGIGYTNMEVLKIVESIVGDKAKVNIVGSIRPYDNEDWVSTNFRSRGWGWFPTKDLRTSIKEMVVNHVK